METEKNDAGKDITFRKLHEEDACLIAKWFEENAFVREWYNTDDYCRTQVIEKYLSYARGLEPTHAYITVYKGFDIGYIQTYLIDDYPNYNMYVRANEKAAGLDLFIGENDYIHKGLGEHIIRKFVREYVFPLTGAVSYITGPEPDNHAAITAYGKAGFTYPKTIKVPGDKKPEYLMRIDRKSIDT
jgi:aminoglycoside 6'-N-acetyltransferase